jgi:hypothetical protein
MSDSTLAFLIFVLAVVGIGIIWADAWRYEPDAEEEEDGDG